MLHGVAEKAFETLVGGRGAGEARSIRAIGTICILLLLLAVVETPRSGAIKNIRKESEILSKR